MKQVVYDKWQSKGRLSGMSAACLRKESSFQQQQQSLSNIAPGNNNDRFYIRTSKSASNDGPNFNYVQLNLVPSLNSTLSNCNNGKLGFSRKRSNGNLSMINKVSGQDLASTANNKLNKSDSNPAFHHRVNSILMQLNVNTFQFVFNDILALGINSNEFVNSYVNSVFKQAVLNPPMALLYSILSTNIAFVMKRTKFGDSMQELLEKKLIDSFAVPDESIDKWRLTLLHGVVTFAGNLVRDNLVSQKLFEEWTEKLFQNGTCKSLGLLIGLLSAGGASLVKNNTIMERLSNKINEISEIEGFGDSVKELLQTFNSFSQMMQSQVSDNESLAIQMKKMSDLGISQQCISLFTRSDSVPVKLSSMAGKVSANELISQFIENPSSSELAKLLEDNNFSKNSVKTATDLLRAAVVNISPLPSSSSSTSSNLTETNVMEENKNLNLVTNMIGDMLYFRFYNENQLKIAFSNVTNEFENDEKAGKILTHIFAVMLTNEVVSFDDFETMFASMKTIWSTIIPHFFCEIDLMLGSWVDDMMESEFWSSLKFMDNTTSVIKQMETMNVWNILDLFPEFDIAFDWFQHQQSKCNFNGSLNMLYNSMEMPIDHAKLARIMFEILISMSDSQIAANGPSLKRWFSPFSSELKPLVKKFGERGSKVASFVL